MPERILDVKGLTKRFGGFVALNGIDIHVNEGERFGLIGPNGSGKTTTINCISGALFGDQGSISFQGKDITRLAAHRRTRTGIVRSFQIPRPFRTMTVLQNLLIPMEYTGHPGVRMGAMEAGAQEILDLVGFRGREHENSGRLTQVDMRKLELARALAAEPKLLISDEAMAGLSNSEVDEILDILFKLNGRGVAVIMIEHIMRAVLRFCERIVVLDAGTKIAEGTPDEIVKNPEVEKAYLGV